MRILSIGVENFLSQNYNISSFILDSKDLSTLIGINDRNCRGVFRAITFAADVLLRKYKDDKSYIKSYFPSTSGEKYMKVSIGLSFDPIELDIISDFVISSNIPRIKSMSDQITIDMKIQALRKCARKQIFLLFSNPTLEITAWNPEYQYNFLSIVVKVRRGESEFFVYQYPPRSGQTIITNHHDSVPEDFQRIYIADLIFDYLNSLGDDGSVDNTSRNKKTLDDCQSLVIFDILDKNEDSRKYLGIDTVPSPLFADRFFKETPELEPIRNFFVENKIAFTYHNPMFLELIMAIYKSFFVSTNLKVELEPNWSKLVLERVDPNLQLLEDWIRGKGKRSSGDFERGLTMLLNLCGYRAIHVGTQYEDGTKQQRHKIYKKTTVGVDVIAFSHDNKKVLICQCCTEWKDEKLSDVLISKPELRSRILALPYPPELHFAVVTCDSKKRLPLDMNIPNEVRIIDIADLLTLLDEVKKGISPYYLVRKIFSL